MDRLADPRAARRSRAPGSRLFAVALAGLAAATVVGSVAAWRAADDEAAELAQQLADRAGAAIETRFETAAAGLSGADAIVVDGRPSTDAFAGFAAGVVEGGGLSGLGLIVSIGEDERAELEASIGRGLFVAGEDGTVEPAPQAPTHEVIVAVEPADLDEIIGFDYGNDPTRGDTLRASATGGRPVVLEVVELQAIGGPGAVIVSPLGGPDPPAGYLVAALAAESLLSSVDAVVGPQDRVRLVTGADLVLGDAIDDPGAASAPVLVADQEWRVVVDRAAAPDRALAGMLMAVGAAGVLVVLTLLVLTRRHHNQMARANAQLSSSEARARAVQDLVGNLSRSLSGDEVAQVLLRRLPAVVGASAGAVAILDDNGALELVAAAGHTPAATETLGAVTVAPGSLVGRTLGDLTPQWLPSPLAWREDETTAAFAGEGTWALALLPLVAGAVRGVLAVAYPAVHSFAEEERDLLGTIGVMTARSLARARRYDAEHAAAIAFQRSALPDALPTVAGLDIAARYRPASHRAAVGGDWYDVLVLDEEARTVAFLVGDVVGHGMSAAAAMGRLRTACQSIAPLRPDPGDLLRAVSDQAGTIRDAVCTTMVCAIVGVTTGDLAWSRAGHPPPLLLDPDGTAELLDDPPLPPLGVTALDPPDEPTHRRALRPGQTLVLYTDGVVERRGEGIDESLRRFASVGASLADLDLESFSDALLEAMVPGSEQADDVALLVVRIAGSTDG